MNELNLAELSRYLKCHDGLFCTIIEGQLLCEKNEAMEVIKLGILFLQPVDECHPKDSLYIQSLLI